MYKYVYAIHNYSEQLQKHDFPGHWDIKPQDRLLGRRRTSDHNAAVVGTPNWAYWGYHASNSCNKISPNTLGLLGDLWNRANMISIDVRSQKAKFLTIWWWVFVPHNPEASWSHWPALSNCSWSLSQCLRQIKDLSITAGLFLWIAKTYLIDVHPKSQNPTSFAFSGCKALTSSLPQKGFWNILYEDAEYPGEVLTELTSWQV